MTSILKQLIELKSNSENLAINLTNADENCLEKLTVDAKNSKYNENDFNQVSKYINCKKLIEFSLFNQNENFQRIHSEMFTNFKSLRKCELKCNHLDLIKTKNFTSMPNLEYLSITESKLSKIENDAFHGLIQLKWLVLSSNELDDIEAECFLGLDHLQFLILNQNKIEEIKEKTFESLINLKALELVENRIKFLHQNSFSGLNNLKILNLNNNKSSLSINTTAFNSLTNLEVLDLASNTMICLDPLVFENIKNLRYLNLSNNLFRSLDCVNGLKKLEALNVLRMKQISREFNTAYLNSLKYLKIEIEDIPIFNESFGKLKVLDLRDVNSFETNCFKNLSDLEFFKLETKKDSIIENIDENLLKPFKKIRYFYIQVEKFGDKSLQKFCEREKMFLKTFEKADLASCETEIDNSKNIIYTQVF